MSHVFLTRLSPEQWELVAGQGWCGFEPVPAPSPDETSLAELVVDGAMAVHAAAAAFDIRSAVLLKAVNRVDYELEPYNFVILHTDSKQGFGFNRALQSPLQSFLTAVNCCRSTSAVLGRS